jgi:hypothetical protein
MTEQDPGSPRETGGPKPVPLKDLRLLWKRSLQKPALTPKILWSRGVQTFFGGVLSGC